MQLNGLLLVLGVHVFADAAPAFGEKVISGGRNVQLLVFVGRRDLDIGVGRDIDVIQRIILFSETCGDLIEYLPLPRDLLVDLPLPVLRVDIVETEDQAGAFLFFHHGGVHLDVQRLAVHHDAVAQGEDAVALDLGHDVLLGDLRKDAVQVVRMAVDLRRIPERGKEIHAFLGLGKALRVFLGRAEFAVAAGLRVHHVDADEVAGEGVQPGVDDALLLDPVFGAAPSDEFVDIRYGDDDAARIVLHPGDPHLHIQRLAVLHSAEGHFKLI